MNRTRLLTLSAALLLWSALPAAASLPLDLPLPDAVTAPGGTDQPAPGERDVAAPTSSVQAAGTALVGTFRITAGGCAGAVTGSYFRMIQPGGDTESGPWVENANSPCADKTYTPLRPGSDGGLVTGSHQPQPDPAFDASGNGTAARIIAPANFFGVRFAMATNPTDPQTGTATAAPAVRHEGGRLSGDLRAVGVAWNRQHFNQGAPKPDGGTPGLTSLPSGTYNAGSGAYTLGWTSTIVGGPFNNFTGLWHLEGTFRPSAGGTPATQPPADSGQSTPATPVATPADDASGSDAGPTAGAAAADGRLPNSGPRGSALVALGALAAGAFGLARLRRRA